MKTNIFFASFIIFLFSLSCNNKKLVYKHNESREKLYARLSQEIENGSTSTDGFNYNNVSDEMDIESTPLSEINERLIDTLSNKQLLNSSDRINEIKQDTIPATAAGPKIRNEIANIGFFLSITAVILSLVPSPIAGAIGGTCILAGFICGIVALNQMKKEPNKYKGKGLAIFSVVLGAFLLFVMLVALLMLVGLI